jgi:hypothetical protein
MFFMLVVAISLARWCKIGFKDVATLALGSRPRQRGCKGAGQEEAGSHITCSRECKKCERMNPHTPEWTPMLGVGVPKGLLNLQSAIAGVKCPRLEESFISLEIFWSINVQNGLAWAIWTSAAQVTGKRKAGSQIASLREKDSRPLKVGNRPDLLGCRRRATYCWKALDEGYNFALDHTTIEGLQKKLCALKVPGVLVGGISGLPRGSPGTKSHLDVGPVESHRVYYKGEGGGFPKSGPWWVLCVRVACGSS